MLHCRDVGERQAANLAAKYKTMKALELAAKGSSSNSSTSSTDGSSSSGDPEISGQMGASLALWFADADNKLLLNELRDAGVQVCQEDSAAAEAAVQQEESRNSAQVPGGIPGLTGPGFRDVKALEGISMCITGSLMRDVVSKRLWAQAWVEDRGGEFHDNLKRGTTWLVVGDKPGQKKLQAAAKWGTRVLNEEQFWYEIEKLTLMKQGYIKEDDPV